MNTIDENSVVALTKANTRKNELRTSNDIKEKQRVRENNGHPLNADNGYQK